MRTLMSEKQSVGAATLLWKIVKNVHLDRFCASHLIHMLAKQETPMKDRMTMLGFVPARLKSLVIITRSMLVLLRAEAIVKPPIRSIIVGENICEKTYLAMVDQPG